MLQLLIPQCKDNIVAEAHACLGALQAVDEEYTRSLQTEEPYAQVVLQGDILPIINYINHSTRQRHANIINILEQCRLILSRMTEVIELQYLPRECNKIADFLAGVAALTALEQSFLRSTPVPVPPHYTFYNHWDLNFKSQKEMETSTTRSL